MNYKKRILVVRLSALGDVAILEPVLRHRASLCPDCLFLLAAPSLLEPLFRGIDNLQFLPTKKDSSRNLYNYLSTFSPDLVLDLHFVNRTIGLDFFFLLHQVPVFVLKKYFPRNKPSWERYNDVFDSAGLVNDGLLFTQSTDFWQIPHSINHKYTIGIAPFAQHKGKIWPESHLRSLLNLLNDDGRFQVLLFGAKNESSVLESWSNNLLNVSSIAGKFSFEEELRMIEGLDLMLSMDSSNMHFASSLGIPVFSIWGATHPCRGFYGWRQNPNWAIQKDFHCRPCSKYGKKPCKYGDYRCLNTISATEVFQRVSEMLV